MHEMSLCEGILQVINDQAAAQNYTRVKKVWVEVGSLACVEPEALLFGFDVVTKGSIAADAQLEIIEVPAKGWCMQCMKPVPVKQRTAPCPECEGYQLQIEGGDELRIREMEVE